MSMEDTLEEIRGLRHGMDMVNSGLWVQALNGRRNLFKEAVEMLQVMEAVVHSQEALQLLDLGRALQHRSRPVQIALCGASPHRLGKRDVFHHRTNDGGYCGADALEANGLCGAFGSDECTGAL
ncbi:hypothetical protein BSKO_02877 [Bryopsis sp. KO-2023]|nr:hypothetical protein BSKO_02877 [Bryopsis sp. KO-2023]